MAKQKDEIMKPEDVDRALLEVKKSIEGEKVTLKKGIVDKRAQGGDTKKEEDYSSGGGRLYKDGKSAGSHPADGGYRGNFATDYPMDKAEASGSGLEEAIKDSAITKLSDKYKRGLTKAVDGSKSSASSKSSKSSKSSVKKGMGSSSASKASVEKAIETGEKVVADGEGSKASASGFPKKNDSNKNSKDKALFKNVDGSGLSNGSATPKEASASESGSASGASRLAVKKSVGKYMTKSVDLITSAKNHISKAFNDGSAKDLDIAGARIIEANKCISKAVKNGETVAPEFSGRLVKAAKYFGKALTSYEADNFEQHEEAINKTKRNLKKALSSYADFKKSISVEEKPVAKEIKKSVSVEPQEVAFVKEGDKYVMNGVNEDTFKAVVKALNEKGLYKSLANDLKEEKEVIDASPLLKGLVDKLGNKFDSLRDASLEQRESDREFKKVLLKSVQAIAEMAKTNTQEIEALKGTPKERKSIVKAIPSAYEQNGPENGEVGRSQENGDLLFKGVPVGDFLAKAVDMKLIDSKIALAWDVDKNYEEAIPQKIVNICERVSRN
jgi:cellobiose-specific phosphotransferase system component IIA